MIAALLVGTAGGCTSSNGAGDWAGKLKEAEQASKDGHIPAATKLYEQALAQAEAFGSMDVRLPHSINLLSEQYIKSGQQEKCLGLFKRAWQLCDDQFTPDKTADKLSDDDRQWAKEACVGCCGLVKIYSELVSIAQEESTDKQVVAAVVAEDTF